MLTMLSCNKDRPLKNTLQKGQKWGVCALYILQLTIADDQHNNPNNHP